MYFWYKHDKRHYMDDSIRIIDYGDRKVVEINTIEFSGKRRIDWEGVEKYLKRYVGNQYVIEETGETVYIGTDFPDEYANSRYREKSFGTIGKAKTNAVQAIPELILTVSNLEYRSNKKAKHSKDAYEGWYYGVVYFSLPVTNDRKEIIGANLFKGRMIIRCNKVRTLYLYDIIDIKKET